MLLANIGGIMKTLLLIIMALLSLNVHSKVEIVFSKIVLEKSVELQKTEVYRYGDVRIS